MERHVFQWTGGRTNTGCLGIRIVYPYGATCLPVNWRKNKHWLSRNQDIVYPDGATCLPVDWRKNKHWLSRNQDIVYPNGATCLPVDWRKNKHWLSRNQESVSEWSDMSTSELEEEQTLVV